MSAEQLIRTGDLTGALDAVREQVRARPSDADLRLALAHLLCVAGEWHKAAKQADVAGELSVDAAPAAQNTLAIIRCERQREGVFSGIFKPLVFGEPEPWIGMMVEALALETAGGYTAAAALRAEAIELAPAVPGELALDAGSESGPAPAPFDWIADADPRLGPMVEGFVDGRYYWVPLHRVAELDLARPTASLDVVALPCAFTWTNGGTAPGYIPVRYPAPTPNAPQAEATLRLARRTEWVEVAPGEHRPVGQRELTTDADEHALLSVRRCLLRHGGAAEPPAAPAAASADAEAARA